MEGHQWQTARQQRACKEFSPTSSPLQFHKDRHLPAAVIKSIYQSNYISQQQKNQTRKLEESTSVLHDNMLKAACFQSNRGFENGVPKNFLESVAALEIPAKDQRIFHSFNELCRRSAAIPRAPFRVLDAPSLSNDFYLNLIAWSAADIPGKPNGILAVAIEQCVYLWSHSGERAGDCSNFNAATKTVLLSTFSHSVTSVAWCKKTPQLLAVGLFSGCIEVWDVLVVKKVTCFAAAHSGRIGAMSWNGSLISSGSKDTYIGQWDVAVASLSRSDKDIFAAHAQEVCGMSWDHQGTLLASGGNDNNIYIWDIRMLQRRSESSPSALLHLRKHVAAVKALAWSPHNRGILASGGGTADKNICIWNCNGLINNSSNYDDPAVLQPIEAIATGSQVCNLAWSPLASELVTCHGFVENVVAVWKENPERRFIDAHSGDLTTDHTFDGSAGRLHSTPAQSHLSRLQLLAELIAHSQRVIHLAVSPDGASTVTGSADETLRFWTLFEGVAASQKKLFKSAPKRSYLMR